MNKASRQASANLLRRSFIICFEKLTLWRLLGVEHGIHIFQPFIHTNTEPLGTNP